MMQNFPNEERRSREIRQELAEYFSLAERAYDYWLNFGRDEHLNRSNTRENVINVSMLLDVQMYRLFRAIVDDCSRGEGFCANILCRSLFETVLAMHFILARELELRLGPALDKETNAHLRDQDNELKYLAKRSSKHSHDIRVQLDKKLRANLYAFHGYFQDKSLTSKLEKVPEFADLVKERKAEENPQLEPLMKQELGSDWYAVIKHSDTYSGLSSIEEIANVVGKGFPNWYAGVYSSQSRMVHANDALQHLDISIDDHFRPQMISKTKHVSGVLAASMLMFLMGLDALQGGIGFGEENKNAIDGFQNEFKRLQGVDEILDPTP